MNGKRNIIIRAVLIALILVSITVLGSIIQTQTIRGTITSVDLLMEKEKAANQNQSMFFMALGFMTANAIIEDSDQEGNHSYGYVSEHVKKITFIGFGHYTHGDSEPAHFYLKKFTNVTWMGLLTYKKLEVSENYQNFSSLLTYFRYACLIGFSAIPPKK
jgi:hypothetical protein